MKFSLMILSVFGFMQTCNAAAGPSVPPGIPLDFNQKMSPSDEAKFSELLEKAKKEKINKKRAELLSKAMHLLMPSPERLPTPQLPSRGAHHLPLNN